MKILILHNRYKFEGGEEAVVAAEADLLKKNANKVVIFEISNKDLDRYSIFRKILLPLQLIWSIESYRKVKDIIRKEKPDIVHAHNTFFLMSPSVYYACRQEKVPVVQTLHNYRFICPLGTCYRDGEVCQECLSKGLTKSIKYSCGAKSKLWLVSMLWILSLHYKNNTFKRFIDTYIALSNFSRKQFIAAGFDQERIKVKPNFISFDPGCGSKKSDFALYIGRFSPEKGVDVLLEAWKKLNHIPLKIIGGGNGFEDAEEFAKKHHINVEFLGQIDNKDVIEQIKKSLFVVVPSRCNENFPRIVVEAFACAKPIIASRSGALAEIIEEGKTGLLFESGNSNDLVDKVELMIKDKEINEKMGKNAREVCEKKYTEEKNYKILIDIYKETIHNYTAK